ATLVPFWSTVLGYRPEGDRLVDPWRRDPSITLAHHPEARLLRNRLHVDVVRPSDAVAAAVAELGLVPGGPYGVLLSDPDGNEADLVPGSPIPGGHASDWVAAFAAMAAYPTKTPQETAELVTAVARSADGAGIPMLVVVRSEGVLVDSGKDMWEAPDGPPGGLRRPGGRHPGRRSWPRARSRPRAAPIRPVVPRHRRPVGRAILLGVGAGIRGRSPRRGRRHLRPATAQPCPHLLADRYRRRRPEASTRPNQDGPPRSSRPARATDRRSHLGGWKHQPESSGQDAAPRPRGKRAGARLRPLTRRGDQ